MWARRIALAALLAAGACGSPDPGPGAAVLVTEPDELITSESGEELVFQVVLTAPPEAEVRLPLQAIPAEEGEVEPAELVFTPDNYDQPQSFTVRGVDDAVDDGVRNYSVILDPLVSADAAYGGVDLNDYDLRNYDDEIAVDLTDPNDPLAAPSLLIFEGFVDPTSGDVGPRGTSAALRISDPPRTGTEVTVRLTLENAEGDASFAAGDPEALSVDLVFAESDYADPRIFEIHSFDDAFQDTGEPMVLAFEIITEDPLYAAAALGSQEVVQVDDEVAGISVSPRSATVCEGLSQRIDIALNTVPENDDVSISFSGPGDDVRITGQPLVLGGNQLAGSITLNAIENEVEDGDRDLIFDGAATTADEVYAGEAVGSVALTIRDNDGGVTVPNQDQPLAEEPLCPVSSARVTGGLALIRRQARRPD